MHEADLRPLDLDAAARQNYDPTHFQPVLFCADSFAEMYQMLREYLMNW
jgi:phenylalanine-4-hydroxylase